MPAFLYTTIFIHNLPSKFQFSNYCLMMINDDVHTYDQVIGMLKHVLPAASERDVMELTKHTDKVGRTLIHVGSYKVTKKHFFDCVHRLWRTILETMRLTFYE